MIGDSKKALVEEHSQNPQAVLEDSPPSYTVSETPQAGPSNLHQSLPNAQPCNFVSVSKKNSSIKGTWLLDPMLSIPSELLPPLPEGESESTRKNLSLQTKDGSINANIFVLAEELQKTENKMNLRTIIDTSTEDGDVTIKMHEVPSQKGQVRSPIQLRSYSGDGSIRVYLPRSFRGVFRIKTKSGKIRFSEAVESSLALFPEVNGLKISFLGHIDTTEWQPSADWNGDELILETKDGSVSVHFDDEENGAPRKGFLSKIFKF